VVELEAKSPGTNEGGSATLSRMTYERETKIIANEGGVSLGRSNGHDPKGSYSTVFGKRPV